MNNNYNTHPEHPKRNVWFAICCFFFAISFNLFWLWPVLDFDFDYSWIVIHVAGLILFAGVVGLMLSFKNSHSNYFRYRKNRKYNRHK